MDAKNILGFDPSELKCDYSQEFQSDLNFLGISEQEWNILQSKVFEWYEKNQPKHIIPELLNKYKDKDNPLGDLVQDVSADGGLEPYINDGLEPEGFFNYIAEICCDECFYNALEPLRKKYNEIVGDSPWKLIKTKGERNYNYLWFIDYCKGNTISRYYDFLSKFETKK